MNTEACPESASLVEPGLRLASIDRRLAAYLIDLPALWAPLLIYFLAVEVPRLGERGLSMTEGLSEFLYRSWEFRVALAAAYGTVFVSLLSATPGKLVLGIRVVRPDGGSPGVVRAAVRAVVPLLPALALNVAFTSAPEVLWTLLDVTTISVLIMCFDRECRAVWDFAANTRVVRV